MQTIGASTDQKILIAGMDEEMMSLEAENKHSSYKLWMILFIPVTKIHSRKRKYLGRN